MGRVINPERAGKERNRLARSVVSAIRQLSQQDEVTDRTRDLAAYIVEALGAINGTIDPTVEAWEKRGYWLKADRYRMDWLWTEKQGDKMRKALLDEDWGAVAACMAEIAARLEKVNELKRTVIEAPWDGAWQRMISSNESLNSHSQSP